MNVFSLHHGDFFIIMVHTKLVINIYKMHLGKIMICRCTNDENHTTTFLSNHFVSKTISLIRDMYTDIQF